MSCDFNKAKTLEEVDPEYWYTLGRKIARAYNGSYHDDSKVLRVLNDVFNGDIGLSPRDVKDIY